jgi:hypothetical protein
VTGRTCWEIEYAWTTGGDTWGVMHVFTDGSGPEQAAEALNKAEESLGRSAEKMKQAYKIKKITPLS